MNKSRLTWMGHVSHEWVTSRMNESTQLGDMECWRRATVPSQSWRRASIRYQSPRWIQHPSGRPPPPILYRYQIAMECASERHGEKQREWSSHVTRASVTSRHVAHARVTWLIHVIPDFRSDSRYETSRHVTWLMHVWCDVMWRDAVLS